MYNTWPLDLDSIISGIKKECSEEVALRSKVKAEALNQTKRDCLEKCPVLSCAQGVENLLYWSHPVLTPIGGLTSYTSHVRQPAFRPTLD